jgi:hypothetical protein
MRYIIISVVLALLLASGASAQSTDSNDTSWIQIDKTDSMNVFYKLANQSAARGYARALMRWELPVRVGVTTTGTIVQKTYTFKCNRSNGYFVFRVDDFFGTDVLTGVRFDASSSPKITKEIASGRWKHIPPASYLSLVSNIACEGRV